MKNPKKVERKVAEKTGILIYCGPNLPGGILQQFTIFKGDLPKHINEQIEKCPAIKELFITPNLLAKFRKDIQNEGTRENMLFNQVLQYERSGK